MGQTTVKAHVRQGRAVQLGQRSTGWLHEEVDAWLDSRPHVTEELKQNIAKELRVPYSWLFGEEEQG